MLLLPLCFIDDVINLRCCSDSALCQAYLAQPMVTGEDLFPLSIPRGSVSALMATASPKVAELACSAICLVCRAVSAPITNESAAALMLAGLG